MDKDVIDLIDTALKIGLGASISGISAYVIIKTKHNIEKKSIKLEKRSELVETIAFKVSEAEGLFNEVANETWAHCVDPEHIPYKEMASKVRVILSDIEQKLGHAESLAHLVNSESVVTPISKNRDVLKNFYETIAEAQTYEGPVATAIVGYQKQLKENYSIIFQGLSYAHKNIYEG